MAAAPVNTSGSAAHSHQMPLRVFRSNPSTIYGMTGFFGVSGELDFIAFSTATAVIFISYQEDLLHPTIFTEMFILLLT